MFRRLADRVGAAIGGTSSSISDNEKVETLRTMGFDSAQARQALQVTHGDVDRAAELLLASSAQNFSEASPVPATTDEALQNAMQESLQTEDARLYRQAQEASMQTKQTVSRMHRATTAATARAGAAAERRAENRTPAPTVNHHPDVKVPAKLQDKTKEEQVVRNANRLKPYPAAVDTLYKALKRLQDDPMNDKFRKIDQKTAGYKRTLEGVPGAEALLLAMNFSRRGDQTLILERHMVDPALLYLGVSALEGLRETAEYKEGKRNIEFAKEVKGIREQGENDPKEVRRRGEYAAKCPSESSGRGALINIVIGNETLRRKFDGDDVLRDVIHWIGSQGSIIPDKILSRDWCLVDLNHFPVSPIRCEMNMDRTLQYLGFWPSGRLEVRPSTEDWKMRGLAESVKGSSRGLGAAPKEALRY